MNGSLTVARTCSPPGNWTVFVRLPPHGARQKRANNRHFRTREQQRNPQTCVTFADCKRIILAL